MNEQILINVTPQETRVAVTEQGSVQELHVERVSSRGLVGNVYLGRVCRVLPGMQSAFVEIGLPRAAFLHVADIWSGRNGNGGGGSPDRPIERILSEGQALLVQVVKDPIGSKGARLSTQVSIAGRLLVYLPQDPHIGISQRIEDENEREQLREKVHALIPPGEPGGFIVRTVAEAATEAELAADIEYLVTLWKQIRLAAQGAAPQELLYQDLSLATRVLRDLVTDSTERIIVDSRETFAKMRDFAERYTRQALPILEHYT
ncbi:MAG TPA: ribonuclease E/G, partial [Usitatibacter sp.]|nr:ribonuclease E/G [Usitatibacter sp.]